jgi:hypothetical protein
MCSTMRHILCHMAWHGMARHPQENAVTPGPVDSFGAPPRAAGPSNCWPPNFLLHMLCLLQALSVLRPLQAHRELCPLPMLPMLCLLQALRVQCEVFRRGAQQLAGQGSEDDVLTVR